MPPHEALYALPAAVELVIDDDISNSGINSINSSQEGGPVDPDPQSMPLGLGESAATATETTNDTPTQRVRHGRLEVSISISEEHNIVHEIDVDYTQDEKKQLWYTKDEFLDMIKAAGYKLPEQTMPNRRKRAAQTIVHSGSSWLIRTLWIGTFVVGVLATTSALTGDHSSKRER